MRILPTLVALCLAAVPLLAQSIRYEVAEKKWDANLGTHRVVVRVDAPADAARAQLVWRRRDPAPEKKGVVVVDARTGQRVADAFTANVSADSGDVTFQPTSGTGEYFVYFLPANPGSGSFPAAKYTPPQDSASAEWKSRAGVAGDAWKQLPEARPVRKTTCGRW